MIPEKAHNTYYPNNMGGLENYIYLWTKPCGVFVNATSVTRHSLTEDVGSLSMVNKAGNNFREMNLESDLCLNVCC